MGRCECRVFWLCHLGHFNDVYFKQTTKGVWWLYSTAWKTLAYLSHIDCINYTDYCIPYLKLDTLGFYILKIYAGELSYFHLFKKLYLVYDIIQLRHQQISNFYGVHKGSIDWQPFGGLQFPFSAAISLLLQVPLSTLIVMNHCICEWQVLTYANELAILSYFSWSSFPCQVGHFPR